LAGQQPPVTQLTQPERVTEQGFTKLVGIKELKDGRVILVDEIERSVLVLDPEFVEGTLVGRVGSGPGEYVVPSRLFSLGGDSSAVLDNPNRRLLVLTPEGDPGGVINQVSGFMAPEASDGQGRFFRVRRIENRYGIVRWSPPSPTLDTVGHFPVPEGARPQGVTYRLEDANPFPKRRAWAVAPDGRIAIVHPDPYRVELLDLDGISKEGPVVPVDQLNVTEGHKEQWREQMARPRTQVVQRRGGERSYVTARGTLYEPADWPRYLPPFLGDAATFAPDGHLWVQRTTPEEHPPTFDVFDTDGDRVGQVTLPHGRRLLGFGKGTLYAVARDEFDLEYLERYRVAR
jgi:hypothetical protein